MEEIKPGTSDILKTGDFIILANGYYLDFGFYLGRGPTGTLQYYSLHSLDSWYNLNSETVTGKKPTKPYKSFVNTPTSWRVAKYNVICFEEAEYIEMYEKSIKALKLLKLIGQ